MAKHHSAGPDLPDGVGNPFSRDVRRGSVDRLEHRGKFPFGIEIGGGCKTDGADYGWAEVGKDIAEKIGANYHVKPVWVANEMSSQDVDVKLIRAHIRVLGGEFSKALVPKRHGVDDAVGLGG